MCVAILSRLDPTVILLSVMRIAILSPFLHRLLRGIERISVSLAKGFAARGDEVHLLTREGDIPWAWGDLGPGVRLHTLALPRWFEDWWSGPAYARTLSRLQPDAIMAFFTWHGEELFGRLAPGLARKTVLGLQYPASQVPHRYRTLARSRLARLCRGLIAPTRWVAEGALPFLRRMPRVVPNGVDASLFCPGDKAAARKRLGLPQEAVIAATVAAFEERKGIHRVLDALPQALREFDRLFYVIAGDGPAREALRRRTLDNGLGDRVRFLGALAHVELVYQAADIFAFPSAGEAFGMAAAEAMSCGLPVVALDDPPLREVCAPEGAVFVPADPAAISAALLALCRDPERRHRMGQANRARALSSFGWDIVSEGYRSVLSPEPSGLAVPQ